ncbi:MAG: uncharacterized protein KVP18_003982 [Porospora cf. gigantea A]|nr:MAG: hypothetical protein KVP18_003982 [Porospora cf. gigantea A]
MHIRYPNVEKLAMGVLEPVSFDWPVDGYMQVLSVIHSLWFMFDSLLFFAWHDKLEYLLAFGAMIGMDVFTSEPISVSLWLHLGYLFCRMVGSIVRFKAFEEVLSLWENVLVQSLLDVFLFCLIVYMRFTVEIKERMDFISHRDHQHRIESLKAKLEIGAAGGTAQVRSGIEHLTDLVRSAKVGLETLIPGCRGHSALEECLEILSHTSTLHSVKFNNLSDNDTKTVETFMTAYDESKLGLKAQTTVLKKASEDRTPRFVRNMPLGLEEVGHRWDLDFITPFEDRKDSLYETALALLEPYLPDLDAPVEVVARFCRHLGASYFNNPYHNQTHGAVVAHCLEYLVRNVPLATTGFTRLERAGFIIAALAHDVCHPGKTNNFIVQSNDPIAILYNDNSPLENMHSCILFTLLEDPRCAVFESIEKSTLVGMKKLMIKMIMSTDMAFHFEVVSNFRVRRHAADFSVKKQEDAELLSGILIKCADISHVCMPWAQHMDWSLRVVEEFYQQGDAEMLMGMQVSAMCDKSTHRRFAKSQATFLEFIGIPIYAEVAKENRELEILTTTVKGNISHWEKLFRESQMINIPSELKQCKSAEHLALARTTLIDKIYTLYGKLEKHLQDMEIMALIAQDKIRNRGEVLKIHKHSQTSKELLMLAQSRHIQRQIRGELEPVVTKERPPPSSSSSSLVPEGASAHGSPRGSPRVRRVDSVAQNRKEKRRMLRQARRRRERRANAKFSQLLESGFMSSRELVGEKRRRSTAVSYIENHID